MRALLTAIFLFIAVACMAQYGRRGESKEDLVARRRALAEAISETQRQLAAVKSDKKAGMAELHALQTKLTQRQRLIGSMDREIDNIDRDITTSSKEVEQLQQSLEQLVTSYVLSVRYDHATRSSRGALAFLRSTTSFNDAARRMSYMKRLRELRKEQMQQIMQTQAQLGEKIGTLNAVRSEKDELLKEEVEQKRVLQQETDQANKVVKELRSEEKKLLAEIKKHQRRQDAINKAIRDLMRGDDEDDDRAVTSHERSRTRNKARPRAVLRLTPEDIELAGSFEGSRGNLYWPVEKGYITDHYGKHPHPDFPKIFIDNYGIGIQTNEDARVRAVFKGVVSKVFSSPQSDAQVVMIKHGNYCTVYNGLSSVSVSVGDKVTARQAIGRVANNDKGTPLIDFQIWKAGGKGTASLDPEKWIARGR